MDEPQESAAEQTSQSLRVPRDPVDDVPYIYETATNLYSAREYATAIELYRRAAARGHADSQVRLGDCYFLGRGTDIDLKQAAHWFSAAADQGHVEGQCRLGTCYANGLGVLVDKGRQHELQRSAADKGHPLALAICLILGIGCEKEPGRGVEILEKLAENNCPFALYSLGICYASGWGADEDRVLSNRFYRLAGNQGHLGGLHNLGQRSMANRDPASRVFAYQYYRTSAQYDNPYSISGVAHCYEYGFGVPLDKKKAIGLYRIAEAARHPTATASLERLGEHPE